MKLNIVVGISGGIAVYKVADIVSSIVKMGHNVDIIMTKNAQKFVTPLTFNSLTKNKVVTDMFEMPEKNNIEHISFADKADLIIIMPATANIIGKIASGIADDFLTTTIMATESKVLIIPAMNEKMYANKIFQDNLDKLIKNGYYVLEPDVGLMACGSYGKGRFPSKEKVLSMINDITTQQSKKNNVNILVTAGPTRETIDPVRFISNKSTGKMGYAIASAAKNSGANVFLISGPVNLERPDGIGIDNVVTAEQMYESVMKRIDDFDVLIMVAAVGDYSPKFVSDEKIKKNNDELVLELKKNKDILKEVGNKKNNKVLVGFSAETNNVIENSRKKLENKNIDIIVANDLNKDGAGFESDTNIVTIISKDKEKSLDKMSKDDVAKEIIEEVYKLVKSKLGIEITKI